MSMHSEGSQAEFAGRFSDGRSAAAIDALVTLAADGLRIEPVDRRGVVNWPYPSLRSGVPLGRKSPEVLLTSETTPSASLFVADGALAPLLRDLSPQLKASQQRWSAAWPGLILGGIVAAFTLSVWLWQLTPTKAVAHLLPERARAAMGQQLIDGFARERRICRAPQGLAALDRLIARLSVGVPSPRRFEVTVLDWGLVNAFAAPGGHILLTSGLLQQATSADEVAGVLAHEVGHTLELHPEAGFIRGVGLWVIGQFLFSGSTGTIGNLGMVLAQLGYSREAEREADSVGLQILRKAAISPEPLMAFFARVEGISPSSMQGRASRAWDILSSHPPSPERIEMIRNTASYAATPALAAADWAALRNICRP